MKVTLCLILVEFSVCLLLTSFHRAAAGKPKVVMCDGQTINLCEKYIKSWKVSDISGKELRLSNCVRGDVRRGNRLLLFVSQGNLTNYGKYKVAIVRRILSECSGCLIQLTKPTSLSLVSDNSTTLIAQKLPYFKKIVLNNNCVLTCDEQKDGLGGILAFRSRNLEIDSSSKIEMSGKGFRGGIGGDPKGGGGYGGETFSCPAGCKMGKGGDVFGGEWSENPDGTGGGGAGDGPSSRQGSRGGPGGPNAGGGGGDSTQNGDDGAGAGGGGGHFSGGGGGGGGNGCGTDGGNGGTAGSLGVFAGGGGQSTCPGGKGGDGGQAGEFTGNGAPVCYDLEARGGNAGSAVLGGGGGDSCGGHFGGGGGGGGLQFGNTDFKSRLSYGGGGGGGGASAWANDPNPGGRGGNGGGLVYLELDELALYGQINVNGEPGECLNRIAHRSAPGGSGAGGSVVIKTNEVNNDPKGKISVSGGDPVKCAFGAGGGGGGGIGRWVVETSDKLYTG